MSDSEAGEVTSSTDVGVKPSRDHVLSNDDSITDSIHISSSERIIDSTNVAENGAHQNVMDQMAFSSDQSVAMPTVLETLASSSQDDGYAIINADQSLAGQAGQVILAAEGGATGDGQGVNLVDTTMLQQLFANQGNTSQITTPGGETIQIIAVTNPAQLSCMSNHKMWQIMPTLNSAEIGAIIINQPEGQDAGGEGQLEGMENGESPSTLSSATTSATTQVVDMVPVSSLPGSIAEMLLSPPPTTHALPPGCPQWAARLKDCEKIGDAFRGWVESEVELDLLLTYHKQQTQSFWGTRQSPSPAKQSTRLMWKSQYVPFDGIPFVNAGSRAVVMECQFGPRRKGAQAKRIVQEVVRNAEFRQTCPARIYIKKVKKFPDCTVDISRDKKSLKVAMDKAFQVLKERGTENYGQERYYVQLPTEASHEFHSDVNETVEESPSRLHPRVSQKIRDLVAAGESRLYAVRKALRKFVERDLFDCPESVPEKHNLTFYPTVNDLQNHIHQALSDIETGLLPVTAKPTHATMDVLQTGSPDMKWPTSGDAGSSPHAETVTVTLTQHPAEDGQHVISRVETHLSDGSTEVSTSLTPETAQLLAKLHPNMFPSGSLLQLQSGEKSIQPLVLAADAKEDASSTSPQTLKLVTQSESAHLEEGGPSMESPTPSLLHDTSGEAMDTSQVTTLEIVQEEGEEEEGGGLSEGLPPGIQIMDSQQGMIIQPGGEGTLPPGLQFISTDTDLTDAQGRPLQILSSVEGQEISFIQPGEDDVTADMGDVDEDSGVITIAMAPTEPHLMKTETMEDAMVTEALD